MTVDYGPHSYALLIVSVIAITTVSCVPFGYSSSPHTAIAVDSSNTADASYITAELFTYSSTPYDNVIPYDENIFTPATSFVSNYSLTYNPATGYLTAGTYTITPDNLYIVFQGQNLSGANPTISIDMSSVQFSLLDGTVPITYTNVSITTGGVTQMGMDTAYKLSVSITISSVHITHRLLTASLLIPSVHINVCGLNSMADCSLALTESAEVVEEIIDINSDNTELMDNYDVSESTNTDYGNNPAVNIADKDNPEHGIVESGNSGNINVRIIVPANTEFIFAVYDANYNKAQGAAVSISVNNTTVLSGTILIPRNTSGTLFFYLPITGNEFASGTTMPSSNWIQQSGNITITISKDAGNDKLNASTKLDLVFKSTSS